MIHPAPQEHILAALADVGITGCEFTEGSKLGIVLRINEADAVRVLATLRNTESLAFTQLLDTFGADIHDAIEITWRLRSLTLNADLHIKASLPYGATLHSVSSIFHSALLAERELCELFGLTLAGHPNPKRLLTIEGAPPFLLKEVAIRTKEELWQN